MHYIEYVLQHHEDDTKSMLCLIKVMEVGSMLCMFCGLCGGPNEGMHSSTTCSMHMYFVLPHVMMNGSEIQDSS